MSETEAVSAGSMTWVRGKSIPVRDVVQEPRVDENGVRDGWMATTDDAIASRMFYPADIFSFELRRAAKS